ncbi:DUF3617 domain-containing protein [Ideonella sp.]|uniref:DUF3617 domain-containing protein n=1 Tax=Ideonella sp. TaxID=1929293 RepID=UPI0035B2A290
MPRPLLRIPLALALAASATLAIAENPRPGLWARDMSVSADGQRWNAMPTSKSCLSAQEASTSIEQMLQNVVSQAAASQCRAVGVTAGGGRTQGRFECAGAGKPAIYEVKGSYASDRYQLDIVGTDVADVSGRGGVVPKLFVKQQGRHVGACPA